MNNLLLKCFASPKFNTMKCKIIIKDKNNNIILDSYTDDLGNILFNPSEEGIYIIDIIPNDGKSSLILTKSFYYSKHYNNKTICFYFESYSRNTPSIRFYLLDSNYNNLPIKKGMINLWQIIQ